MMLELSQVFDLRRKALAVAPLLRLLIDLESDLPLRLRTQTALGATESGEPFVFVRLHGIVEDVLIVVDVFVDVGHYTRAGANDQSTDIADPVTNLGALVHLSLLILGAFAFDCTLIISYC